MKIDSSSLPPSTVSTSPSKAASKTAGAAATAGSPAKDGAGSPSDQYEQSAPADFFGAPGLAALSRSNSEHPMQVENASQGIDLSRAADVGELRTKLDPATTENRGPDGKLGGKFGIVDGKGSHSAPGSDGLGGENNAASHFSHINPLSGAGGGYAGTFGAERRFGSGAENTPGQWGGGEGQEVRTGRGDAATDPQGEVEAAMLAVMSKQGSSGGGGSQVSGGGGGSAIPSSKGDAAGTATGIASSTSGGTARALLSVPSAVISEGLAVTQHGKSTPNAPSKTPREDQDSSGGPAVMNRVTGGELDRSVKHQIAVHGAADGSGDGRNDAGGESGVGDGSLVVTRQTMAGGGTNVEKTGNGALNMEQALKINETVNPGRQ